MRRTNGPALPRCWRMWCPIRSPTCIATLPVVRALVPVPASTCARSTLLFWAPSHHQVGPITWDAADRGPPDAGHPNRRQALRACRRQLCRGSRSQGRWTSACVLVTGRRMCRCAIPGAVPRNAARCDSPWPSATHQSVEDLCSVCTIGARETQSPPNVVGDCPPRLEACWLFRVVTSDPVARLELA